MVKKQKTSKIIEQLEVVFHLFQLFQLPSSPNPGTTSSVSSIAMVKTEAAASAVANFGDVQSCPCRRNPQKMERCRYISKGTRFLTLKDLSCCSLADQDIQTCHLLCLPFNVEFSKLYCKIVQDGFHVASFDFGMSCPDDPDGSNCGKAISTNCWSPRTCLFKILYRFTPTPLYIVHHCTGLGPKV